MDSLPAAPIQVLKLESRAKAARGHRLAEHDAFNAHNPPDAVMVIARDSLPLRDGQSSQ